MNIGDIFALKEGEYIPNLDSLQKHYHVVVLDQTGRIPQVVRGFGEMKTARAWAVYAVAELEERTHSKAEGSISAGLWTLKGWVVAAVTCEQGALCEHLPVLPTRKVR